jgi:hypothetical protein
MIPLRSVVGGVQVRLDFDLTHGVVLHDYLRQPAGRSAGLGAPVGAVQ